MAVLLDKSILIHAPPERVYAYLAPPRVPLWDKSVVRFAPRHGGPVHRGDVLDRVTRALGYRFEATVETVEVDEGHVFAWRQVEGDYEEDRGAFVLSDDHGATRVRFVADVELPFVLPRLVTEAEVRAALSKAADDALFNLKALAEAR